jgi:uncharacterized protein (TIGR03083 family)
MWHLIEAERRSLADLLEDLTPQQWEAPSLCTEWRVRDVAAHVAMTPAGAPNTRTMVVALARTRGHLWAAGRDVAIAYADRAYTQLVGELRRGAAARSKPVFVVADNILPDLVVHGQDIAVPLGLHRAVPPAAGRVALQRLWTMGWPFHARRRLAGLSLRATDADWSAGDGAELRGTAADLLLLISGRTAAVADRLQGPGAALLRPRAVATA